MPATIILAYNARSDLFSKISDFAHKIISPETYNCQLCSLTYGNIKMKEEWRNFLDSLPHQKKFLYKNDVNDRNLLHTHDFPAIFLQKLGSHPEILVNSLELNKIKDLAQLMELLENRLNSNA